MNFLRVVFGNKVTVMYCSLLLKLINIITYFISFQVGMPIVGDQPYFGNVIQEKEYGLSHKISSFTEAELLNSILEVLNSPKYTDNIKTASEIFHNQQTKPLERAVHWVEHVIKYGGDHVRSRALDMPWWQYLMLDVIVTIGVVVSLILGIFIKVVKWILSKLCKQKVKKE